MESAVRFTLRVSPSMTFKIRPWKESAENEGDTEIRTGIINRRVRNRMNIEFLWMSINREFCIIGLFHPKSYNYQMKMILIVIIVSQ